MRFLRPDDIRFAIDEQVFRESRVTHLLAAAVMAGAAAGMAAWYAHGKPPLAVVLLAGGVLVLCAAVGFRTFLKTHSPDNWLLALDGRRIAIKFRSFHNAHLPRDDVQIVELDVAEVRSARKATVKVRTSDAGGQARSRTVTYVELSVDPSGVAELREHLRCERRIKASFKVLHYPVSVSEDGTIRVEWRSPSSRVVPGADRAVELLGRHVATGRRRQEAIDLTDPRSLDKAELEGRILSLAEQGRVVEAVKVAVAAYGIGTRQAKAFVEGLLE